MTKRNISIDIMKGLLVIGMIFAHIIQFFGINQFPNNAVSLFINLIAFSGFFFAFGYANHKAYFTKSFHSAYPRMLKNIIKTLIAFYISGICSLVLLDNWTLNTQTIFDLIALNEIPRYSEFLVSFSGITLLALVLFKPINYILNNKLLFWFINIVLLSTTFIPYHLITIKQFGIFIGTETFSSFSVVQYMPFFLIGLYFSKYDIGINLKYILSSIVLSGVAFAYYVVYKEIPLRFPVSIYWLSGSAFFLYGLFYISRKLQSIAALSDYLQHLGRNVLLYLLLSNILIFAFSSSETLTNLNIILCGIITTLLLASIWFIVSICSAPNRFDKS